MYKGCFSIKRKILESLLVLAIVILFIIPVVSSTSMLSFSSRDNYDIYHHQSDVQKTSWYIQHPYDESSMMNDGRSPIGINEKSVLSTGEPMNSSWPMYCHDTHHTGRSPYSTAENPPGVMKWRFENDRIGALYGSSVIDKNGIIYFGGLDFFAVYPNGTLKWQYGIEGWSESCPAIDSNGTIYVASAYGDHNYIYAFYPNGIMKWRYYTGNDIFSSPAIGVDGTIFFGCGQSIVALFPNGTLRWQHSTNHVVYSSPAIGDDGTVYCGCHDTYLYALYPNNGTMKWMFKTGDWIRVSPCIADDGTIYCVSLDSYLYAIYPNGTMKWRTNVGAGTSPTIGQDGTIYAGWSKLYAVNPVNGSVKWIFNSSGAIQGGTPCNSLDGTIYFGTISGYLIAVNPNGTEAGRAYIGKCESAPAIGEDGTIYIGSMDNNSDGYLNAFGPGEPKKIEIQQPEPGKLYLFGLGMGNTLLGNTAIIGSVKVKVHAYSWNEIESVHFYVDGIDQYNLTKPPFEWRMNQRYGNLFPLKHTITVIGYYEGGYSWSESIDVMYFHLLGS